MIVKISHHIYVDPDEVESLYSETRLLREIVRGGPNPYPKDEMVEHHTTQISMKSGAIWTVLDMSAEQVATILTTAKENQCQVSISQD